MTNAVGVSAHNALRLLQAGLTPEEVEARMYPRGEPVRPLTALSDPTNVVMQEVSTMAQPTARGPVEIMGVTTRTNSSENRKCTGCLERIDVGVRYERVARIPGPKIESFHVMCFEYEFGKRELYGG